MVKEGFRPGGSGQGQPPATDPPENRAGSCTLPREPLDYRRAPSRVTFPGHGPSGHRAESPPQPGTLRDTGGHRARSPGRVIPSARDPQGHRAGAPWAIGGHQAESAPALGTFWGTCGHGEGSAPIRDPSWATAGHHPPHRGTTEGHVPVPSAPGTSRGYRGTVPGYGRGLGQRCRCEHAGCQWRSRPLLCPPAPPYPRGSGAGAGAVSVAAPRERRRRARSAGGAAAATPPGAAPPPSAGVPVSWGETRRVSRGWEHPLGHFPARGQGVTGSPRPGTGPSSAPSPVTGGVPAAWHWDSVRAGGTPLPSCRDLSRWGCPPEARGSRYLSRTQRRRGGAELSSSSSWLTSPGSPPGSSASSAGASSSWSPPSERLLRTGPWAPPVLPGTPAPCRGVPSPPYLLWEGGAGSSPSVGAGLGTGGGSESRGEPGAEP